MLLFRATIQNSDFGQSDPVELVIAAGGGGGGSSGGSGAADPSDCVSIVFYDWDGTTVLGSTVVVKGQDATPQVEAFTESLISPLSKSSPANTIADTPFYVDDENYPLTFKKGYSFEGCWLPLDSNTPTIYGSKVNPFNAAQMDTLSRPTDSEVNFSNVSENIIVKACYMQNDELEVSSAVARRYSAEAVSYTRYGTTPNYSITLCIKRENTSGEGVPRAVTPALRVALTTPAGTIYQLIEVACNDVTYADITVNASVTRITYSLVDTFGCANWIGAGDRLNASTSVELAGVISADNGFLFRGTLGGINSMLEEYTISPSTIVYNYTNIGIMRQIGLDVGVLSNNEAKDALLAAWRTKNTENGTVKPESERVGLTLSEMQQALDGI